MNMSCRTDYDCSAGNSCRSKFDGGTECKAIVGFNDSNNSTKYQSSYIPKSTLPVSSGASCKTDSDCSKKEFCWSVNDSDKKECQARLPSNKADEKTAKNTDQKEITTNVIWKKDGIAYLPNENKPFTGKYEEFHSNGEKKYVTIYDDGKRKKGIYWDEKGEHEFEHLVEKYYKTSIVIEEKNGVSYLPNTDKPYTGISEEYYASGRTKAKKSYINGKQDGKQESWYENGQKEFEVCWKNGKHDGIEKYWHENGQKTALDSYSKNGRDRTLTLFYENGQKATEMNYKNGKYNGLTTAWYENGQKSLEENYKDDEKDGTATFWHGNGQKGIETRYKNGKQNGVETSWDEDGKKIGDLTYKDDALIENSTKKTAQKNELCEAISNLAEFIMKHRQNGLSMSVQMKHRGANSVTREMKDALTIAAYEKPRFSSGEYQKKSIEDFRDKAYLDCVKAAR